jgi:glutamate-1-semialdehyde 2,1-aminomutase
MIEQVRKGITFMLPTEDAIWVGEEMARRFGLPYWQVYMTASDANRFAFRMARAVTGRDMVLIYHGSYHGSIDETSVTLKNGKAVRREPNFWRLPDPSRTTRIIEFNDVDALEKALAPQDIAFVVCEPAMTDVHVGIVYPEPGYHDALRELTRRYGTLLILDETHTIAAGPGGLTREMNLDPDILTLGKPIAGGMPVGAAGFSQKMVDKLMETEDWRGIGGTLSANALALAALRATLEKVMTESAYEYMISLAKQAAEGSEKIIKDADLPWCVTRLGSRIEYGFQPAPPKDGALEVHEVNNELGQLFHIYMITHGVLMTPFHNIVLTSPATTEKDVDFYNGVFGQFVNDLIAQYGEP